MENMFLINLFEGSVSASLRDKQSFCQTSSSIQYKMKCMLCFASNFEHFVRTNSAISFHGLRSTLKEHSLQKARSATAKLTKAEQHTGLSTLDAGRRLE